MYKFRDTLDVNQANKEGFTPLHYASQKDEKHIVKLLMYKLRGKVVHVVDSGGFADTEGRELLMYKFLDTLDVNQANKEGFTPLHIACQNGDKDIVELLVDKFRDTLDVNQVTKKGVTPLLLACSKGYEEIVSLLLTINEIDVNLGGTLHGQVITPLSICEMSVWS